MVAPIGNKFAVGNYGGRPPKWTKELIEEEARLFIEWAQLPTSMILREFAAIRGYGHRFLYEWPATNEVFRDAFDFAKTAIGIRRENYILEKAANRDLPMYYDELHKFETSSQNLTSEEVAILKQLLQNQIGPPKMPEA